MNADPSDPAPSTEELVEHIVSLTIVRAVTRTERLFAIVRAVFCLAIAALFLAATDRSSGSYWFRAMLELGAAGGGMVASLVFFLLFKRRSASEPLRITSVAIDCTLCLIALSGNALYPTPDHPGLTRVIDPAIIPLIIMTSVLRVSRAAVAVASAICVTGLGTLIWLQYQNGLSPDPVKLTLLAVYTCSSIALAFFTTNRAREIFSRVGRAVLRAEGARGGVFALLQDHHDFRSTLGSLQLRADRLGETLEQTSSSSPDTAQLRLQLQQSIDLLSDATQKTRDRALGALSGLTSPSAASVDQALATARKDPGLVGLRVDVQLGPTEVLFGGGTEGLARLLGHFLVNAVEGNGRCGAEGVSIRTAKTAPALIDLILEDDGPGFSEEMLKLAGRSRATSTKDGSAGIGLWLSRSTVLAAGGSMRLTNTPGGARVSLRLPSAKAADLDTDDS